MKFAERQCKRRLPKDCSLLLITNSAYYSTINEDAKFKGNSMVANLMGFLFTNQGEVKKIYATRGCDIQGNYYAYLDSLNEKEKWSSTSANRYNTGFSR